MSVVRTHDLRTCKPQALKYLYVSRLTAASENGYSKRDLRHWLYQCFHTAIYAHVGEQWSQRPYTVTKLNPCHFPRPPAGQHRSALLPESRGKIMWETTRSGSDADRISWTLNVVPYVAPPHAHTPLRDRKDGSPHFHCLLILDRHAKHCTFLRKPHNGNIPHYPQ